MKTPRGVDVSEETSGVAALAIAVAYTADGTNKRRRVCLRVCASGRGKNSGLAPLLSFDRTECLFFQTVSTPPLIIYPPSVVFAFSFLFSLFANALRETRVRFSRIANVARAKRSDENDAIKREK